MPMTTTEADGAHPLSASRILRMAGVEVRGLLEGVTGGQDELLLEVAGHELGGQGRSPLGPSRRKRDRGHPAAVDRSRGDRDGPYQLRIGADCGHLRDRR